LITPLPVLQDELHHLDANATFVGTSAIWRIAEFGDISGLFVYLFEPLPVLATNFPDFIRRFTRFIPRAGSAQP
jgi:hypothetical protein